MKKQTIIYPLLLLLLLFSVIADFNFIDQSQITTITTNNTVKFIGYDYNASKYLYLVNNSTVFLINSVNALNGSMTINSTCANSMLINSGNNSQIYVMPSGNYMCIVTGSSGVYNRTHQRTTLPSLSDNTFYAFSYNSSNEYFFEATSSTSFVKKTFPSLVGSPALNCYTQVQTAILNNYGVNITALGGFNQSVQTGTLIQGDGTFYFKSGNHWFKYTEENQANCNDIAEGFEEITIEIDAISSNDRYVISSDEALYTNYKDGAQLYIFTSGSVDIYDGLVCDNGVCYNQSGSCLPESNFYFGDNASNYLCTNVSILGFEYYCYIDNLQYCSGGCNPINYTNAYSVVYTSGECLNSSDCENDCSVEGYTYSDTLTSYKQCGFYDNDLCLDYSSSITCASNEISINGDCELNNFTAGSGTLTGFTTLPYPAVSYNYNSVPQSSTVASFESFYNLGFKTDTLVYPYFMARNCNYTSETLLSNNVVTVLNSSNPTQNIYYPSYDDGILYLRINPDADEGILIKGEDVSSKEVYSYYLNYNTTSGLCIWKANSTHNDSISLGCLASSTLVYSDIEVQTIGGLHEIKVKAQNTLNPPTSKTFYGTVSTFDDETSSNLANINVTMSGQLISYSLKTDSTMSDFFINKVNVSTDYNTNRCLYTSSGCYDVRTYYLDYGNSARHFWNYKDWEVCVTLGYEASTSDNNTLFDGLSNQEKLFLGLGISVLLFFIILVIGMSRNDDSERKTLIFASVFVLICSVIFFTIIGWLDAWIIISAILLGSIGMGYFFIRKSGGE